MAPRFVFCPDCNRPAHLHERRCPFCDAPLGPEPARAVGAGVALTVGLSLAAGCERPTALAQAPVGPRGDAAVANLTDATAANVADASPRMAGLGLPASDSPFGPGTGFGVYGAPPSALQPGTRPGPRVRLEPPSVEGALSPDIVRRVALRNLNQVLYCVRVALDGGPAPTGRVAVRVEIDAQGAVARSTMERSSLPMPSANECIVTATRRWQFPAPDRGTATLHLAWLFQPSDS